MDRPWGRSLDEIETDPLPMDMFILIVFTLRSRPSGNARARMGIPVEASAGTVPVNTPPGVE